jgi:endogenous inhibitor of DNA gyrase (YacG/DUF329 family)
MKRKRRSDSSAVKTKTDKCPWCGKTVEVTKKNALKPHLTPGGTRCHVAIPRHQWPEPRKD